MWMGGRGRSLTVGSSTASKILPFASATSHAFRLRRTKKSRGAGSAFVQLTNRPSAAAYQSPGEPSTYSRSVLGARGRVEGAEDPRKGSVHRIHAICAKFSFPQSSTAGTSPVDSLVGSGSASPPRVFRVGARRGPGG